MSMRDDVRHCAREAAEVIAAGAALPYAALIVSSMVLGFEVFRG